MKTSTLIIALTILSIRIYCQTTCIVNPSTCINIEKAYSLWNSLTYKSILNQAEKNVNKRSKNKYQDAVNIISVHYKDSIDKYDAFDRKAFIDTFHALLEIKTAIIIEKTTLGEKIKHEKVLLNYDKIDSISIIQFELTFEGWKVTTKSSGEFYIIDLDFEKYRCSSGDNFPTVIMTRFEYGTPVKSSYFLPYSIETKYFNGLILAGP